jgi:UDP-N-acetyl-D-mannosaminuronic acid dehydrogenase
VLEHVYDCCRSIIPFLTKGSVVIIESTVPVGCSRKIAEFLEKESALKLEVDLFVACSPERLMPGQAFKELVFCDRVIGGMGQASSQLAVDFYSPLIKGSLFQTSLETAELVKITENSHRAVQIAFANQMSNLAKSVGVDPFELVRLANKHPRVNVAMPGIGIGGDCVPVHPLFLKEEPVGYLPSIVEQALEINRYQEELVVADILNMADRLKQKRRKLKVLILGLTYKPNVADIRNSPAIRISQTLSSTDKFTLKVFDPYLEDAQFEKLGLSSIACLSEHKNMDLIIFLVGHDKFAQLKELNLSADKYYDPIGFFQKTKDAILEKESTVN